MTEICIDLRALIFSLPKFYSVNWKCDECGWNWMWEHFEKESSSHMLFSFDESYNRLK